LELFLILQMARKELTVNTYAFYKLKNKCQHN